MGGAGGEEGRWAAGVDISVSLLVGGEGLSMGTAVVAGDKIFFEPDCAVALYALLSLSSRLFLSMVHGAGICFDFPRCDGRMRSPAAWNQQMSAWKSRMRGGVNYWVETQV